MTRPVADLKWIKENCDKVTQVGNWKHYFFNGSYGRDMYVSLNDKEKKMDASFSHSGDEVEIDMDAIYYVDDFKHMLRMIGRKDD